ncbi:acetyl-CoA carboxylase carboxyltransferase subunit alpha [Oceanirhabdus sp. W0125-5]|uniref:acetyl-CoA carboxylase carboxyltransferase subunit alpha n=1 Tax=Oceanirhabdus sp. W0125-5 TaxID=2999116 RepID=UPI0022F348A4|nr:acetyl-CoA carboxylase carboxyltransferase subunit alpha [Oceanirhabdus sp. W0125-5]WBW97661.1 acetyl-CoA carboxylase carboxyltransferase subunit alpha [Oceanirhabdus sp. W0125-5]
MEHVKSKFAKRYLKLEVGDSVVLDFEKKLYDLRDKIDELKKVSEEQGLDLSAEIELMEKRLDSMKEDVYTKLSAWQKVKIARLNERPTAMEYIEEVFDDFIELHGDRGYADDHAIVGGLATLNGINVTVIGIQKGRDTKENIYRNFGMPHPEGYRKALRLMKQAEKFNRPVICLVDTPGAYCGIGAEERGQGEAIARNLMEMANLKTPIVSIIIGEGGSGGALALAVADEVWMLEHSIYSILSPEGFASILFKDATRASEAAETMKITSEELLNFGIIDRIIKEPLGGAHKDKSAVCEKMKANLVETVTRLQMETMDSLLTKRYSKFRQMGEFFE